MPERSGGSPTEVDATTLEEVAQERFDGNHEFRVELGVTLRRALSA
jgi:hypothetical protein